MGSRSSTAQSLPGWAVGPAQSILGAGLNYIAPGSAPSGMNALNVAPFDPSLQANLAPFTAAQQAGLGAVESAAAPSAGLALGGANEIQNTLSGQYLNPATNPYLGDTYKAAADAVTKQYQTAVAPGNTVAAQQAGVAGGSADRQNQALSQYGLGQNLQNLAAQIYGGNYANERAIQAAAPGQIGAAQSALSTPGQQLIGAGTLEQGQQQAGLDIATQNAQLRQQWLPTLLSFGSNLLGGVTSGGGVTTAGTSK